MIKMERVSLDVAARDAGLYLAQKTLLADAALDFRLRILDHQKATIPPILKNEFNAAIITICAMGKDL